MGQYQASPLAADPDSMKQYVEHFSATYESIGKYRDELVYEPISPGESKFNFSVAEVCETIGFLPNGKAPGPDGLIGELLKPVKETICNGTVLLFFILLLEFRYSKVLAFGRCISNFQGQREQWRNRKLQADIADERPPKNIWVDGATDGETCSGIFGHCSRGLSPGAINIETGFEL